MDKGTASLKQSAGNSHAAAAIEREIESIRDNLDDLMRELDHRRHQLNPFVAARKHPAVVAAAGLILVAATVGGVSLMRTRQRRFNSWAARGRGLGTAVRRLLREPETAMAEPPGFGKRVLAAGASAAVTVLARQLARRLIRRRT